MPAERQNATERNIPLESARVNLTFSRAASDLVVEAIHVPEGAPDFCCGRGAQRQAPCIFLCPIWRWPSTANFLSPAPKHGH